MLTESGNDTNLSTNNDVENPRSRNQNAVSVRHAFKQYGSRSNPNPVLINLNMTVAKGTIYGLLGASGCGKTTLLSCLVGQRTLNSGEVYVLGGKPGTKGSGIPGKQVGYMPQETALYGEFTIKETMLYFGWIFGMTTEEIEDRTKFLLQFLDLPSEDRLVKDLSGGQQRRVSFACALVHDPDLLILDEPTVGVDPLLRHKIWNDLVHRTNESQKTVIITTHYIEEAGQAHTIGLMRTGRLLAEASPARLLAKYQCEHLEDVFLKLSRKQENADETETNTDTLSLPPLATGSKKLAPIHSNQDSEGPNFQQSKEVLTEENKVLDIESTTKGKMRALFHKNFLRLWRNIGVMMLIFALPVTQAILFCLAVGHEPRDLRVAVANGEVADASQCPVDTSCSIKNWSCRYMSHLNKTFIKDYYPTPEASIAAVRAGHAWGAIYFPQNFTSASMGRMRHGMWNKKRAANEDMLDQSNIRVWLDMSNPPIGIMFVHDLLYNYKTFAQELLRACGENPKLGDIPVRFMDPVYGINSPEFTDFIAPGVIITILFFAAVALTSMALIMERTEGLLDRSLVAGVTPFEILFSHVFLQFLVMCIQTVPCLFVMLYVFNITCVGSIFSVVALTMLQGMCGMCYGFAVSSMCDLERTAIQLVLGSFFPTILLSGVFWPIEGIPSILRHISYFLPLTQATTALRWIMARGWGLKEREVYLGFVSTLVWIAIFLAMTMVALRKKSG